MKLLQRLFSVSLILISITALITSVTGLLDLALPYWAKAVIGIVNLISVPILLYASVKSMKEKAAVRTKQTDKKKAGTRKKKKKK